MEIRILTKNGDKVYRVTGNPIILETIVGQRKRAFHINQNGSLSKIRGKRNVGVVEMLENRQISYQK